MEGHLLDDESIALPLCYLNLTVFVEDLKKKKSNKQQQQQICT